MDDETSIGALQAIRDAGRTDIKVITGGGGCQEWFNMMLADENQEGFNLNNLRSLPIYSASGNVYPLESVVDSVYLSYHYNVIKRYNRERVMMAQCDPVRGANTKAAFTEVLKQVREKISLPEGYRMQVFGEEQSQEESNAALAANMPLTFILIFITLLLLFRAYKKPIVILLMVVPFSPAALNGVEWGIVLGKQFDFFAMLGLLGLVGMNIKNAIVLVDQIGVETSSGKSPYEAVTIATRSRIVPVMMASGTTILGMLPLLFDSMFGGMAATIMGGLLVASLLTLLVLPVTYCIFFRIYPTKETNS